jgi:hypothetical protein
VKVKDNCHLLFTGLALDWYFRYRETVDEINLSNLCHELTIEYSARDDNDLKENIRDRKQRDGGSFEDFYHAILCLEDQLLYRLDEDELLRILMKNLRPEIRQQIFMIDVTRISQLRKLCMAREAAYSFNRSRPHNRPMPPPRYVNEVAIEDDTTEIEPDPMISEISPKLICWNCRNAGHGYMECLAPERKIFCYGCGLENTLKPNCPKCSQKNFQRSERQPPPNPRS